LFNGAILIGPSAIILRILGMGPKYRPRYEISLSKTVCHHFSHSLIAGAEFWGHLRNLMGTHWELERNMLGTKEK